MKLCESCRYRNNTEYEKPCIVYRDDCEYYEKERGDMTREEAIKELQESHDIMRSYDIDESESRLMTALDMAIKALEQEQKTGWNNHQIACMLADLFGDACACNYNGIDEWLGELCDFKDTCCPNPVGVACWEQFLKYSQSRYTECGYEVRDKNALQEQKTGHWKRRSIDFYIQHATGYYKCSECGEDVVCKHNYCPNCGCRMVESRESEDKE